MMLAERLSAVAPSMTLAITAKTAELKAQGLPVIGLSAGEPDFDTPQHIREAAKAAIDNGHTRYTAVDGIPELKQAVIHKFKRDNNLTFTSNQIMISTGGKQTLFNAMMALLQANDEVIIPAPYWVSYPDMVKLMGAEPIFVTGHYDQQFKITANQLADVITPRTKMVILNSPSNPSGAVYSADELSALATVIRQHPHIVVMTDDMYEHILLQPASTYTTLLQAAPDLADRVLISNGVSKAYAMTGWRIGYVAGPAGIIAAMKKIQGQSTSNPCSVAQHAALAALNGSQDVLLPMMDAFRARHDFVVERANSIPGLKAQPAQGAFYSFINIEGAMAKKAIDTDLTFAEKLLEDALVALVPGTVFGLPGHVRISFATNMENLTEAMNRIETFVMAS